MEFDLKDKTLMITGGTGSFGRKCVETLLKTGPPRKLIIYSRDELKQYEMQQQFEHPCLRFYIGDVRDKDRLHRAMNDVNIVIHAAALKQVPACEKDPIEAVKTNIMGAVNIIDAAIDSGVEKVIGLSTDKAVNPSNFYGATKLCSEKLFVQGNAYSGTDGPKFSCVRYGNVVGSRGSAIPLFLQQKANGVITVTDKRMTRFWITLEKGVDFVLRCLQTMNGGEIFVPKIPSMNIMDLVKAIAPECEVSFTGIRPGEKVHEVLVSSDEASQTLEFPHMYVIHPPRFWTRDSDWNDGQRLSHDFQYGSYNNPDWLTVQNIQEMVADL